MIGLKLINFKLWIYSAVCRIYKCVTGLTGSLTKGSETRHTLYPTYGQRRLFPWFLWNNQHQYQYEHDNVFLKHAFVNDAFLYSREYGHHRFSIKTIVIVFYCWKAGYYLGKEDLCIITSKISKIFLVYWNLKSYIHVLVYSEFTYLHFVASAYSVNQTNAIFHSLHLAHLFIYFVLAHTMNSKRFRASQQDSLRPTHVDFMARKASTSHAFCITGP